MAEVSADQLKQAVESQHGGKAVDRTGRPDHPLVLRMSARGLGQHAMDQRCNELFSFRGVRERDILIKERIRPQGVPLTGIQHLTDAATVGREHGFHHT